MQVQNTIDLGRAIQRRRQALKWTQRDLADRHGTTQKWISLVENGKDGASMGQVLRLLKTLGLQLQVSPPAEASETAAKPNRLTAIIDRHR